MMKVDVELSLAHNGEQWVGRNAALVARGDTLDALDEAVTLALRESGEFPEGSRVTVFMGFDFDTIPNWLRQYHTHYFNRRVTIEL